MKLQRLLKKNKSGSISFLDMYTKKMRGQDVYVKYRRTGIIGKEENAKTSEVKVTSGKNIGRKNETTVKQQAEKELRSEWDKELYSGYNADFNYVQSIEYNTFPDKSVMPMLLNKYKEPKKDDDFVEGYLQRKYDGVRCIAEKHNGEVRLKSREGKIFNIPHILDAVKKLMAEQVDCTLDGELYIHGVELHDITAMVKNDDPNMKLEYHVYDVIIPKLTFSQRRNILLAMDVSSFSNIYVDTGVVAKSEEDVKVFHKESLELGFEGSIFCDPDSLYDCSFRTNSKRKLKPRVTSEFECIDHYWNKGKMSKQSTLICRNKDGRTFHVKLKGTAEQREHWAANFDAEVKGKMITVEYRKLSKYKVPIEAVGVAIRDYE